MGEGEKEKVPGEDDKRYDETMVGLGTFPWRPSLVLVLRLRARVCTYIKQKGIVDRKWQVYMSEVSRAIL